MEDLLLNGLESRCLWGVEAGVIVCDSEKSEQK